MKKLALGIMAVAISFASMAQSDTAKHRGQYKGAHKEFKQRGGREFGENLNLTEAQKSQVKTLNENFRNQMKALREDQSLSDEARKEKARALKTQHKSQIQALLTPEQKKQWEEQKGQGRGKNHGFKGKGGKKDRSAAAQSK